MASYWKVDWTKVKTFDDMKRILQATGLRFEGELAYWPQIEEFLVFDYPRDSVCLQAK